jgi:hypothetical protein
MLAVLIPAAAAALPRVISVLRESFLVGIRSPSQIAAAASAALLLSGIVAMSARASQAPH